MAMTIEDRLPIDAAGMEKIPFEHSTGEELLTLIASRVGGLAIEIGPINSDDEVDPILGLLGRLGEYYQKVNINVIASETNPGGLRAEITAVRSLSSQVV